MGDEGFVQNVPNFEVWDQIHFIWIKNSKDFDQIFILENYPKELAAAGAHDPGRRP